MRIKRKIYSTLIDNCPAAPPEVGGVLGGNNGIITNCAMDFPANANRNNRYAPDTEKLNSILTEWAGKGITFYGMFHTHFPLGYSLSKEDEEYIRRIMYAMPAYVEYLFFPVVVPGYGMASFKAVRESMAIRIKTDSITIIF